MGQQQLLLIVLGLIIVAVAIAFSISLFRQAAIDSKRDLIMNENTSLGNLAIQYYKKAKGMGGGGSSFIGWSLPANMQLTASGTHEATIYSDSVVIIGTGNEVVTGTDSVKARTTVFPNSMTTVVIN